MMPRICSLEFKSFELRVYRSDRKSSVHSNVLIVFLHSSYMTMRNFLMVLEMELIRHAFFSVRN